MVIFDTTNNFNNQIKGMLYISIMDVDYLMQKYQTPFLKSIIPSDYVEAFEDELEQRIRDLTSSDVYKVIDKKHISLVREPIKKTNVVLKNVNFQYAMKLWNYLRDNFDDKTKDVEENEDYMEQGEKKKLFDETFMLQYLIMKTLDQDEAENEGTREEVKETILEQMVNNLVDMDQDLTEEELNKLIANKYEVIKYKKMEAIKEIQKIFREHIDKYLSKVEKED